MSRRIAVERAAGSGISLRAQRRILAEGHGPLSARAAGCQLYRDALEHVAGIAELRLIAVGLPTDRPIEVYRLWFWMTYAALVQRRTAPRPRLPLSVIDGEDRAIRAAHDLVAHRFHRQFAGHRTYLGRGADWVVGGSVHQDSALHPFVQMADLVAGAARHAMAARQPYAGWYATHLEGRASSLGRAVDASRHAHRCLSALTPDDACGSGWPEARLTPPAGVAALRVAA